MNITLSRSYPPLAFIPVNNNHLGARNELIPVEYSEQDKIIKRTGHHIIRERKTEFEDNNKARETPLHPPY